MPNKAIEGAFGLFDYSVALGAFGLAVIISMWLFINERKINKNLIADMLALHKTHIAEIKEMQKAQLENSANTLQETTMAFNQVTNVLTTVREILRIRE